MGKKFYASKTFWFNIAAVTVFVIPQLLGPFGYEGAIGSETQELVNVFVPALVALANIILRFVTKEPVEL
jgi:hypothetical protein